MKKVLLFVMAVSFGLYVSAQGISVGAKFGPGFSNVHGSADMKDAKGNKINHALVVPHFGVFATYGFSDLISAQVELNYAGKGYKIKGHDDGVNINQNFSIKYIEIPILAKATFGEDWPVQVFGEIGPFVGFNTGATIDGNKYIGTYKVKDEVKGIDFGFIFGAGGIFMILDNLGVLVDMRYTLGLVDINDYPDGYDGEKNSVKTGVFNIDFGAVFYLDR
jgi:hypothetical protein